MIYASLCPLCITLIETYSRIEQPSRNAVERPHDNQQRHPKAQRDIQQSLCIDNTRITGCDHRRNLRAGKRKPQEEHGAHELAAHRYQVVLHSFAFTSFFVSSGAVRNRLAAAVSLARASLVVALHGEASRRKNGGVTEKGECVTSDSSNRLRSSSGRDATIQIQLVSWRVSKGDKIIACGGCSGTRKVRG